MAMSLGATAARQLLTLALETTCSVGILDCGTSKGAKADTCAPLNVEYIDPKGNYIMLVFTAIFAAAMAFSIGGNDGANAWATSVHSFAIKLRPAVMLAAIFEILGASTLGYGVSSSIQKGISKISDKECFACGYCDSTMSLYYVGMMAALIASSVFLLTATYFRMPVSTTHSIVSSVLGMTVAYHGFGCIQWGMDNLGGIIASWVISPVMSGLFCLFVYYTTYYFVFAAKNSRTRALIALPVLYFVVVFVVAFLTIIKAPSTKSTKKPTAVAIAASIGGVVAILVIFFLLPWLKKNMPSVNAQNKLDMETLMKDDAVKAAGDKYDQVQTPGVELSKQDAATDLAMKVRDSDAQLLNNPDRASLMVVAEYEALNEEQQDAMWMFKYVLILVACLQSFAHGSNDTANATAAFSAVVNGFNNGAQSCSTPETEWWIMLIGGSVLALGILLWGYKVMETIGKNIAIVNFHRAFCTEFASSCTVVVATLLKLPVSSTHCQVGAVIFVSMAAIEWKKINWSLISGVCATWVFTLPISALVAALFAWIFKFAMKV